MRGPFQEPERCEVASSQYSLLLCSETLVSDRRHISELLVPGFGRPVLLCRDGMPRARGMVAYVQDGYGAFRHPNLSVAGIHAGIQGVWCQTELLCVQSVLQPGLR